MHLGLELAIGLITQLAIDDHGVVAKGSRYGPRGSKQNTACSANMPCSWLCRIRQQYVVEGPRLVGYYTRSETQ